MKGVFWFIAGCDFFALLFVSASIIFWREAWAWALVTLTVGALYMGFAGWMFVRFENPAARFASFALILIPFLLGLLIASRFYRRVA
ncbi:MAG: hypothetical protein FJW32_18945 [Acidobacteria bacterium]|nr:hypothetical protein [Acidobacteriota bacterium]